jgi:hypothetical protein
MFRNIELKKLRLTKLCYAILRRGKLGNVVKPGTSMASRTKNKVVRSRLIQSRARLK